MEWKYKIGDVILLGRNNKIIITGRKEEECSGGIQRMYLYYQIVDSLYGLGPTTQVLAVPDIVLEELDKTAKEYIKNQKGGNV